MQRASTASYGDRFAFKYLNYVRTSQETRVDLHCLLQGWFCFSICKLYSYFTGNTRVGLHCPLQKYV
jgi:hypothetical protein